MNGRHLSAITLRIYVIDPLVHKLFERLSANGSSRWVEWCAVARWFDEEMLSSAVFPSETNITDILKRFSFIENRTHGYTFHDVVRESIYVELRRKSPQHIRDLHLELANYYRSRLVKAPCYLRNALLIEMIYHLLRTNKEEGFDQLKAILANEAVFLQFDLANALLETTNGLTLNEDNKVWVERWKNIFSSGE